MTQPQDNPNNAKASLSLGKPAELKMVSLKLLCQELRMNPRIAREKLRIAVREQSKFPELAKSHKPRIQWEWSAGSAAEREARRALTQ